MGKFDKPPLKSALPMIVCLCMGACLGAVWAMGLEDEQRRRIQKNLFELRELPFRVFI
jgi:hypothetical protein